MRSKPSIIHLGIYGKTAAKSIRLLVAGLREHISWQEKDPVIIGRKFTGDLTDVQVDPSGEVILSVRSSEFLGQWRQYNKDRIPGSAYARELDVGYIKSWFAKMLAEKVNGLKTDAKLQLHPGSKTSPTSRAWEVAATADALLGEDVEKKWGKAVFDRVVGAMADPISTEVAEVIAEEAKRISREYKQKHQEMHMKMLAEIESVRRKYRAVYAELGKQERAAITAMKRNMAAV
jgi:hypothetical protein